MTEASPDTNERNLHEELVQYLLDRVREDRYPSTTMLDMLEATAQGPQREEFVDILLEKVTADRFPSIPMLERLRRVAR
jgi:hypothetical protein